jgi:hypothetical protein
MHTLSINLRTNGAKKSTTGEDAMTSAAQAFLFTAELFALSFFAIFLIWLADRL